MSKFIISLGKIDKKLILPLIYIIIFSLIIYYAEKRAGNMAISFIECIGISLGSIMTYFISIAFKYKSVSYKKRKEIKKYFKDIFLLFIINFFYLLSDLFLGFL